jgi:hypothetical protein
MPRMSLAVVRAKLAAMIPHAEAMQARPENVTYQMYNMVRKSLTSHLSMSSGWCVYQLLMFQSYEEEVTNLASQIPFLRMYSTRGARDIARDFGGCGITQTGMGGFIEQQVVS